jgi:phage shock protein E
MFDFLKLLFKNSPKVNFKELIQNGAQLIDVRTVSEYKTGHIKGSINIPLQSINSGMSKLKKDKPIITCCASGNRSGVAKSILLNHGYSEVHNGGGWMSLQSKI